jgi:hypothetical protein
MKLKFYTLLALISITYLFLIKTTNTFVPLFFTNEVTGKSVQVLSFIAHLLLLVFYITFLIQYVPSSRKFLYWASILSVANSVLMGLLYFRGLVIIFPGLNTPIYNTWPALFQIIHSPQYLLYSPFIGWVNSLILFIFLLAFYRESPDIQQIKLHKANLYAIWGSVSLILVNSGLLMLQLFGGGMGWLLPHSAILSLIFLPIFVLVFIAKFNFFLQFYHVLKTNPNEQIEIPN